MMNSWIIKILCFIFFFLAFGMAQGQKPVVELSSADKSIFGTIKSVPIPKKGVDAARFKLGQMLFHEKRISKNHDISCNSCHTLTKYGVDGEPTSLGHKKHRGSRNSPTVLNAFGHFSQFWDGRAADVEAQAKGPVLNPDEMAMPSDQAVLGVLRSMPEYVKAFDAAFPKAKVKMTYDNFFVRVQGR